MFKLFPLLLTFLLACSVSASVPRWFSKDHIARELSFYHTHTKRSLTIEYYRDGKYIESALVMLKTYLGDFRNGQTKTIDPALFDLLFELKLRTQTEQPFEIISAYRSPETNAMLKRVGRGVATRSMHIEGKAIDIRLNDVPVPKLREIALALQAGGVGYYPKSNFIHVDTGRVRRW